MTDKLVQIKNLKTFFNTEAGVVKAVNNVSFDINIYSRIILKVTTFLHLNDKMVN